MPVEFPHSRDLELREQGPKLPKGGEWNLDENPRNLKN